jgi:aspartate/methionine/tyrosine aminotransferase|tara:strand:- start:1568 stop:2746 length:1179 start_codon:yes stop_codon:yes gene_type:complete
MSIKPLKASQRMRNVQPPIISIISDLIKKNPDTISLGQGVVYYGPPETVFEKISNLNYSAEHHVYSEVEGIPALRSIITKKLKHENGINLTDKSELIVSAGSNMAFMNAILAISDPGDEIILLRPYYFNHEMAINMINCKAVTVDTDSNYQPCLEKIIAAINSKTRAIVTVSPNNPTGAVYEKKILEKINNLCREKEIYHISDEAYEYFIYGNTKHFSPASISDSYDYTISLYSLSKAYGFASWRIGYMVIPKHLSLSVKKAQDTYLICPTRIAQEAAISALEIGVNYAKKYLNNIEYVRDKIYSELREINDICTAPLTMGAFYFLVKLNTNLSGLEISEKLISKYKIAVIPGETFGMNDGCYLRIGYGSLNNEMADIGTKRLIKGLKEIII